MVSGLMNYLSADEALNWVSEHNGAGEQEASCVDQVVPVAVVLQHVTCQSIKPQIN